MVSGLCFVIVGFVLPTYWPLGSVFWDQQGNNHTHFFKKINNVYIIMFPMGKVVVYENTGIPLFETNNMLFGKLS